MKSIVAVALMCLVSPCVNKVCYVLTFGSFDPPDSSITVLDELESGRVALPVDFSERAHISGRDWEEVTIWFPVAPMGFVALGCVVTKKREVPDINCVRCLRADLASQKGFSGKAIWTWGPPKTRQNFSFWPVNNQVFWKLSGSFRVFLLNVFIF